MATTLAFTVTRSAPELVAPSRATPRELRPLSDIDDQDGLRFYRSGLHFFRASTATGAAGAADPAAVVRKGLADALVHYYPVAGRIREVEPARKLVVDCTGDGVVFVEADADVSLSDFGDVLCPPFPCYQELLCEPDGNCAAVVGRPLLFVQVTRLRCGGFVFGLQICHNIADAAGTVQLLRAIGEMSRGMPAPTVMPVWARELLMARSPPVVTHRHPEYDETAAGGNHDVLGHHEPLVQRAFFFGPKEMSALRELVARSGDSGAGKRISRFDMLAAFLWQRRAAALKYADDDEVRVMFVVNARGRSPPLPAGFYGNAFAFAVAACTAGRLCDSPLADVLNMVAGAKARAASEGNLQSVADLMAQRARPRFGRAARTYLVSDVTRAGFEGVDFGWGEGAYGGPAAATLATFHLTVKDASGEEVIAVPMCLPAPAMERLELDVHMSLNH
uniref:Uncharacterized protein n=1 Tax=Oryza punctata TaxID=4537 RepID=A0A0E0LM07_ORYPU